jgi:FkbM family methyltransferase
MNPPGLLERIGVRVRWLAARLVCLFGGGRYKFTDRFGMTYYLWPDTRLADTLHRGVRIDDEGLLHAIRALMDRYNAMWGRAAEPSRFVAFDIGAFIGIVTLAIATRTGPTGCVFTFEPLPGNAERIKANVRLNKLSQVEVVNAAVSDAPRQDTLKISHSRSGNYLDKQSAKIDAIMAPTGKTLKVDVVSVESFAAARGVTQIDIMKVDAEFQDLAVLRGAGALLREGRIHYLFVEEPPQDAAFSADILTLLDDCKYRLYHIVRRQPALVADLSRYPYGEAKAPLNVLAVSPHAPFPAEQLGLTLL